MMEAAVSTPSGLIHPYTYTGRSPHRGGSDGNVMDGMHLPTLDGEVTLTTAGTGGRPMEAWAELLEEPACWTPSLPAGRAGWSTGKSSTPWSRPSWPSGITWT